MMRRYTPLFLIAFIFCVVLLVSNICLEGYADNNKDEKIRKSITVYTTLPVETAVVLAEEYEKENKIKINFIFMNENELLLNVKEKQSAEGQADAILADKEILIKMAKLDAFVKYNLEETDIIADRFKDKQGAWVGLWYDPIVFCANKDYLKTLNALPTSWKSLAELNNCRIGITDFLVADASSNLLYTLIAEYDEQKAFNLMKQIHPKIIQYSKYLSTPVRMAGMGDVDISIAVQSESIRYINDEFPIALIYPSEGTAYTLTGIAMLKSSKNKDTVKEFMHWLLGDEVQLCLQKNKIFFVPTNPMTLAYKSFGGKNLNLFENYSDLTKEQKDAVLDRWIKNIRLN